MEAGLADVGAAPHRPAGYFSPYSDGEKYAVAAGFANRQRSAVGAVSSPLPVHGEKMPAGG
ncbi:MAG: hypothetical protein EOS27_04975 [Mesorhizobium sp.]|nr:MAG: hypothetical protein EOS27_04975 [Mesorhizobium sp.]